MRRKGEDTFAMKRRRAGLMSPRSGARNTLRSADRREIDDMVQRIAADGEHWAKTRAMQH